MFRIKRISSVVVLIILPAMAQAQAPGFFAGLDTSVGIAHGSSDTSDGGGFGGGGIVKDVKFGNAAGIGAHAGYQFDRNLSGFVSYQHVRGDIDWAAEFPGFGQRLDFSGKATSNAILVNLAYGWNVSDATTIRATAGVGATHNKLSNVTETYQGAFVSDVEKHTKLSPMVQVGASLQHQLSTNAVLGLNAMVAYTGGFRTGNTRKGNLGVSEINPYEIDDVWRASLGVSLNVRF